jgi:hypothetical protein
MKVGFTGTRRGLSGHQYREIEALLDYLEPIEAHDGDCLGGDATFHHIAHQSFQLWTVGYPCTLDEWRAFGVYSELKEPKPPLERNEDIVDAVDLMIACPGERRGVPRGSGTWFTIRYATKIGRHLVIIYPDGSKEVRNA